MKNVLSIVALLLAGFTQSQLVRAADDVGAEVEKVDSVEETTEAQPKWESTLKSKYSLTDAQIQSMRAAGLKGPQIAMTAELSKASGKSIEEVTKMRTEGKMGWGKIAKELGVEPKQIGQSVAETRKAVVGERKESREARKEAREAKREARQEAREARREARKEAREARKEARREKRGN